jgi:hypothetical protein
MAIGQYRRVVRVAGGWQEEGSSVRCGWPAVIPWRDVGNCWAGKSHPVVVPDDEATTDEYDGHSHEPSTGSCVQGQRGAASR